MLSMRTLLLRLAPLVALAPFVGCSSADPPPPPAGPTCATLKIDRFKEVVVVDEGVLSDARTRNDVEGPWSFHHAVKEMAPPGADPSQWILTWLRTFEKQATINLETVPTRPMGLSEVTCPWLLQTPSNQCDANCASCAAQVLDLKKAPFRLLAIVYRPDLAAVPGQWKNGEGRLVFTFTDGPGDDAASVARDFSLIFEYRLPATDGQDLKSWAQKWHALGKFAAFDESYRAALQAVTDGFVGRGKGDPGSPNGSSLNQARTNERVMDWQWQLREYKLDGDTGQLAVAPLDRTPAQRFDGKPELLDWIRANKDLIAKDQHTLPVGMLAGAVTPERWNLTGIDLETRNAFARKTCNGCHAEEQPVDTNFQISPHRKGVEKLSKFMHDPSRPGQDDIAGRERAMSEAICEKPTP